MAKLLIVIALAAFVAAASAGLTEEQKAKAAEMHLKCAEELKMSPDDVNKIKSHDFSSITEKCFPKCVLEKSGIMANGAINEATAIEKMSQWSNPAQASAVVKQCIAAGGADPCEIAAKFLECSHKQKQM